jgi:hypothetical protein
VLHRPSQGPLEPAVAAGQRRIPRGSATAGAPGVALPPRCTDGLPQAVRALVDGAEEVLTLRRALRPWPQVIAAAIQEAETCSVGSRSRGLAGETGRIVVLDRGSGRDRPALRPAGVVHGECGGATPRGTTRRSGRGHGEPVGRACRADRLNQERSEHGASGTPPLAGRGWGVLVLALGGASPATPPPWAPLAPELGCDPGPAPDPARDGGREAPPAGAPPRPGSPAHPTPGDRGAGDPGHGGRDAPRARGGGLRLLGPRPTRAAPGRSALYPNLKGRSVAPGRVACRAPRLLPRGEELSCSSHSRGVLRLCSSFQRPDTPTRTGGRSLVGPCPGSGGSRRPT